MSRSHSTLFQPIQLGPLPLDGRIIKSAMVETKCSYDGFVSDELIEHYGEMARAGTPLMISGACSINHFARGVPHQLSADHDDKIPGLSRLAKAVHDVGGKMLVQLYHTARQASPEAVGRKIAQAPSAVYEPTLGVKPKAMSLAEIQQTVMDFADAAERCKKAGMDGVQIHAAHGYLISSFLTPHTNRRKDQYGGSFSNRIRFLEQVYVAIRERVGDDFAIILKINGSDDLPLRKGLSTQELLQVAKHMEQKGIDGVEISAGFYESCTTFSRGHWKGYTKRVMTQGPGQSFHWFRRFLMVSFAPLIDFSFNQLAKFTPGFNLKYAKQFTTALNVPVICVGGMSDPQIMAQALANGDCDLISVARGFIADPYLYHNLKYNKTGPQCDYCNACFTTPGIKPLACINPQVAAQRHKMLADESALIATDVA